GVEATHERDRDREPQHHPFLRTTRLSKLTSASQSSKPRYSWPAPASGCLSSSDKNGCAMSSMYQSKCPPLRTIFQWYLRPISTLGSFRCATSWPCSLPRAMIERELFQPPKMKS